MSEFQRASRAKRNLATALAPAAAYLLGAVAGEDGALEVEFGVLLVESGDHVHDVPGGRRGGSGER